MAAWVAESERSIPACAGETAQVRPAQVRPRVDPRVCGGDDIQRASPGERDGRSPRVRGRRLDDHCSGACQRSIPACAGETGNRYASDWQS